MNAVINVPYFGLSSLEFKRMKYISDFLLKIVIDIRWIGWVQNTCSLGASIQLFCKIQASISHIYQIGPWKKFYFKKRSKIWWSNETVCKIDLESPCYLSIDRIFHKNKRCIYQKRRFEWPMATLILAPAVGQKGPSSPSGHPWPHLK